MVLAAILLVAATLTGIAVTYFANGQAWLLLAELAVGSAGAVFLIHWRWGVFAILVYLPVAGMVSNFLYPAPAALLLNDGLIGFTYVGFAAALSRRQVPWVVPTPFLGAFLVLCGLSIVEAFNPQITSPLVALVGFRVLLFYIPLFILGFSLAQQSPMLLERLVWLVLMTSLPVCIFGIWEWFQGPSTVSQLGPTFARTLWVIGPEATNSFIFHPASTFDFVGQFSDYLMFVTLISLGALLATSRQRTLGLLAAIFGAAAMSVILSASRTTWFELVLAVFAMYVIRGRSSSFPRALPLIGITIAIAITVGQPILDNRLPFLTRTDTVLIHLENFNPFRPELLTWQGLTGHGTGSALGAVRHVSGSVPIQFESGWYIPLYMFGVLGLVAYLLLYAVVLRLAWSGLGTLASDRRWLGAAIFCYLLVTAAFQGAINYPPANVFFWLFAGLLAGQATRQKAPAIETFSSESPRRHPPP